MTTLTETFKSICKALDVTLIFADLHQANNLIDQLKGVDYPVLVIMPYEESDNVEAGTFKSNTDAPLEAYMLTKLEASSIDAAKVEVQEKAIEPMLSRARRFMKALNASVIIKKDNPDGGIGRVTYTPTFSEFDANLFGVVIRTNIPLLPRPC